MINELCAASADIKAYYERMEKQDKEFARRAEHYAQTRREQLLDDPFALLLDVNSDEPNKIVKRIFDARKLVDLLQAQQDLVDMLRAEAEKQIEFDIRNGRVSQ